LSHPSSAQKSRLEAYGRRLTAEISRLWERGITADRAVQEALEQAWAAEKALDKAEAKAAAVEVQAEALQASLRQARRDLPDLNVVALISHLDRQVRYRQGQAVNAGARLDYCWARWGILLGDAQEIEDKRRQAVARLREVIRTQSEWEALETPMAGSGHHEPMRRDPYTSHAWDRPDSSWKAHRKTQYRAA
jgi:multidrug efflux pump subunit AcrA (membrane-fusion protein)